MRLLLRSMLPVAAIIITALAAQAKDHSANYQVGIFASTGQLSDGTFAYCSGRNCKAYSAGHNIHYVRTPEGLYTIQAPFAVGKTLAVAMLTDGIGPQVHQQWFMDQLHEGDKILFSAKCDKHNNCTVWLPDPDKAGKEFITIGYFSPDSARSNTQTLCGKGKLKPEVEAQVCPAAASTPPSAVPSPPLK